jgi:hypothetical protein
MIIPLFFHSAMTKSFKKIVSQPQLPFDERAGAIGDLAHEARLRGAITRMIRRSPLGRAVIADRLSQRLGEQITEDMLNNFTADSHRNHRIPLLIAIGLSVILEDRTILDLANDIAGFKIHSKDQEIFLELGRAEAERLKVEKRADKLREKATENISRGDGDPQR